jgi:hypothetical protein
LIEETGFLFPLLVSFGEHPPKDRVDEGGVESMLVKV